MIVHLACALAALTMQPTTTADIHCISQDAADAAVPGAAGWYDGDTNDIYVVDNLTFAYTRQVLAHEVAHEADLTKGTELNGYPSFFSETHTGFDVEEWARMVTYTDGVWPTDERYPDAWIYQARAASDIRRMTAAGWIGDSQ